MATEKELQQNSFKSNNILYYALIAGQIMIAAVLFYLTTSENGEVGFSWEMDNPFHLIAPTLLLGSIVMSTFLYNSRLREGRSQTGFFEKLQHYRATIIIRCALMEGANLVCLLFFFLEQNYFFLFLFLIGLAAFLMIRPSVQVFKDNYKLTEEERMELRKMTN